MAGVKRDAEPNLNAVLKALSNETRLQILEWLKDPRASFGSQEVGDFDEDGVCVSLIQKKIGLSQSTTSHFLAILNRAGLVRSKRIGQWTYFQRDEEAIRRFTEALGRRVAR
jgi:DNA-binding transcriptional ArsR family regulator